jgi:chemotaxis protein MotB
MRNSTTRFLTIAALLLVALTGYFAWEYLRMREALEEASGRNAELMFEANRARDELKAMSQRLEQDLAKVSKEKEAELERLKGTHDEMVKGLQKEIEAGEVTITRLADRLSVKMVDRILFPTGEAAIGEPGRKVLERVAKVLAQAQDKTIRIEGHTDNIPIGKQLRDRYPTNWELSTARATTVARILQQASGLDPAAFEAVGLGEFHPVADNRTEKGRSLNRRIEIQLYPRVRALAQELPVLPGASTPATPPARP